MKNNQGSLLVLVLLVSAALVFFGLAFVALQRGNNDIRLRAELRLAAEAAASAGIDDAIYQLKKSASWNAGFNAAALPHSMATYRMSFDETQAVVPFSTNNSAGSAAVIGYGGRSVPPNAAHIVSVGSFQGVSVTEEALVSLSSSVFKYSMAGSETITLGSGVTTDSFNSSNGTYAATQQSTGGDLVTNSTASGAVQIKSGAVIGGTITIGPGGTAAVVSSQGTYQSLVVESTPLANTAPTAPTGTSLGDVTVNDSQVLAPGLYDQLTVTNNATVTLSKGTYVFSSIDAKGQGATINIASGPVTVYFTGEVNLGHATVLNSSGIPGNLVFLGTSTATAFALGEGSTGYYAVYAPTADITSGQGSTLYGAIVGKNIDFNQGVSVHFDQALMNYSVSGGTGSSLTVLSRW